MKPLFLAPLLSAAIASASAAPIRNIQTCVLEDQSIATLQAQQVPAADGDHFYVSMDGKTENAFTDIPGADYVGKLVLSKCLDHILVFAISYGAPYFKGALIRRTAADETGFRIDFAEKGLPELIYRNNRETMLVIPNIGHEVASKYLIYRYQQAKGQGEAAVGADTLPAKTGYEVIRIDR
jgi:hypothetical protein